MIVSTILALSAGALLFFGANAWFKRLIKPEIALPMFVAVPIHVLALVLAGFGSQIVMGNVSGNPAVGPARRSFSIWIWMHGLWILLFGALHFPVLSLGFAVVQWGVAVYCIQKFYNVDPLAGQRVTPFFITSSYWMIINGFILTLNDFP